MIKAVIFDCFGVLIGDALGAMTSQLVLTDPNSVERIKAYLNQANTGQTTAEHASRQIAEVFGMPYADYRAKLQAGEVKDQVLLEYIKQLRAQYKTAMLSNVPKNSLHRRFTPQELADHFDVVVASGEIGYAKPEAQAYEIVADRLGVRLDECIFTDDREPYCEGARSVGMQAVLYTGFNQFRSDLKALLADA
jgi:epoxide hydrolase-like predicted phosphatase